MEKLIQNLKEQTQELKALYLEKTSEWAKQDFERISKSLQLPIEKWYEKFNVQTTTQKVYNGVVVDEKRLQYYTEEMKKKIKETVAPARGEYGKKNIYKMRDAIDLAKKIVSLGLEDYESKQLKLANMHYENSIVKLASRIVKKDLDQNKLTLSSSRIKMNFETTITDGKKTVRAFTILAWGEIQRPHYRYLIK